MADREANLPDSRAGSYCDWSSVREEFAQLRVRSLSVGVEVAGTLRQLIYVALIGGITICAESVTLSSDCTCVCVCIIYEF